MDEHPHDETALASTILIRPVGKIWSLEDEKRQVGGVFVTLEAALAFARAEQLNGAGAIRVVVGERPRTASPLRAA